MANSEFSRLGREFARTQQKRIRDQEVEALTGHLRDNGSITLFGDGTNEPSLGANEVYIRFFGQSTELQVAWNFGVAMRPNIPVLVKRNRRNRWTITGLNEEEATDIYATAAPGLNNPEVDISRARIYAQNFFPGRLRLKTAATLLTIADDFLYLDTSGALKKWTADSGYIDLTSNVPSSGNHNLILISLNPSASSPALVATALTARAISFPFGDTDLGSFAVPVGYVPLGTIRLVSGDTTWTADRIDYNVRGFLQSAFAPAPALQPETVATPIRIPSGYQSIWYSGYTLTSGGSLTIEGTEVIL